MWNFGKHCASITNKLRISLEEFQDEKGAGNKKQAAITSEQNFAQCILCEAKFYTIDITVKSCNITIMKNLAAITLGLTMLASTPSDAEAKKLCPRVKPDPVTLAQAEAKKAAREALTIAEAIALINAHGTPTSLCHKGYAIQSLVDQGALLEGVTVSQVNTATTTAWGKANPKELWETHWQWQEANKKKPK